MSGYAVHPEAFLDLDQIRAYIAKDNPDAADRVITEIFERFRKLVPFPHQGHRRPDLTSSPLRFTRIYDYFMPMHRTRIPCGLSRCYMAIATQRSWQPFWEAARNQAVPTIGTGRFLRGKKPNGARSTVEERDRP